MPGPACLPFERLGDEHTPTERGHVQTCARCQAEIALWQEFQESAPEPEDGAAVQWVVAELRRRRSAPAPGPRRAAIWAFFGRGLIATAMTLVLGLAVGYLAWDREPAVQDIGTSGQPAYRASQLHVVAPVGDVGSAPRELQWKAPAGATQYDVVIMEVDRTEVWRSSSQAPRVALPPAVVSRFVPGKPFLWEVVARNGSGAAIAESGTQRFRVLDSSSGGG